GRVGCQSNPLAEIEPLPRRTCTVRSGSQVRGHCALPVSIVRASALASHRRRCPGGNTAPSTAHCEGSLATIAATRAARTEKRVLLPSTGGGVEPELLPDPRHGARELLAATVGRAAELAGNGRPIVPLRPQLCHLLLVGRETPAEDRQQLPL